MCIKWTRGIDGHCFLECYHYTSQVFTLTLDLNQALFFMTEVTVTYTIGNDISARKSDNGYCFHYK
jgi:hypothetical protein